MQESQGLEKPRLIQLKCKFLEGFQRTEMAALHAGRSSQDVTFVECRRAIDGETPQDSRWHGVM